MTPGTTSGRFSGADEHDQAAAFWTGFAHGVGLFLADSGISTIEWEGGDDA